MKLTILIAAMCAGSVTALPQTATAPAPVAPTPVPAAPVGGGAPAYAACGISPYSGALCCATDVLGVVDLDCHPTPSVPTSASNFSAVCAALGQRARCCVLPIAEQGALCQTPVGVNP